MSLTDHEASNEHYRRTDLGRGDFVQSLFVDVLRHLRYGHFQFTSRLPEIRYHLRECTRAKRLPVHGPHRTPRLNSFTEYDFHIDPRLRDRRTPHVKGRGCLGVPECGESSRRPGEADVSIDRLGSIVDAEPESANNNSAKKK